MQPKADRLNSILIAVVAVLALLLVESRGMPAGCDVPTWIVPSVAPISEPGLRILIVEESQKRGELPPAQLSIFTSAELAEYASAKCVKVDGVPEFRVWDPDVSLTAESEVWKKAMAIERKSLPWLVVSDGRRGFSGQLPGTVAETMSIVRRYGG